MNRIKRLSIIPLILIFSGCGTIIDNTGWIHLEPRHQIYGGIRLEYDMFFTDKYGDNNFKEHYCIAPYILLIDFPVCIVTDTAFLPYAILFNVLKKEDTETIIHISSETYY